MAYAVEPGIYLPGKNGVRLEDDVVITKEGPQSLSTMTRVLAVLISRVTRPAGGRIGRL
jgi:Xaa-Pro aminopeptidase